MDLKGKWLGEYLLPFVRPRTCRRERSSSAPLRLCVRVSTVILLSPPTHLALTFRQSLTRAASQIAVAGCADRKVRIFDVETGNTMKDEMSPLKFQTRTVAAFPVRAFSRLSSRGNSAPASVSIPTKWRQRNAVQYSHLLKAAAAC